MKRPPLSLAAVALIILGCASAVLAENTVQIGFEAPAYNPEVSLQSQDNWSVSAENPDGLTIRGKDAEIVPPEGSQMLEIVREVQSAAPAASRIFAGTRGALTGNFTFSFLVAANAASNAAIQIAIGSSFETQTGAWVGLRKTKNESGFGFFYWEANDEAWQQIGDETIPLGEFVRFKVAVSTENMNFSVKVLNSNGQVLAERDDIPLRDVGGHLASGKGINRIFLSADQWGPTHFYLDDLKVEPTP